MRALTYAALAISAMLGLAMMFCGNMSLHYMISDRVVSHEFDKWVTTLYSMWTLWNMLIVVPLVAYRFYCAGRKPK